MNERQKQSEFLKSLLACEDCAEHRELHDRIVRAERDERCMRRACRLVIVITFLALAVLGYLTVLEISNSMSWLAAMALRFAQVVALGSAMCAGLFIGLGFWQRALIHRMHSHGRKLITAHLQSRARSSMSSPATVIVHQGDTAAYPARTHAQAGAAAEIMTLPKAS